MMFRKPLFAAALLTGVAILGLSPALAQNPLAQANPGTPATITRPMPVEHGKIVKYVPPMDPVTGQPWVTEWPPPRPGSGHARM